MAELKLIASSLSLFCTRIEWALKLKGVKYEYLEEDLRNKSPLLRTHRPVHKKVPVLLHNDPYEKAIACFWAKFADEKCLHGAFDACRAEGNEKEKAIESAAESFAFLEKQLEGKKYFGREQIGYLDLAFGWIPQEVG
ncbi:Glutathione S-transferase [Theobroma cacao]|nr:Glutathione S-transferase [Theobroma cacao]